MNWLLLHCDRVESAEDRVEMLRVRAQIEDRVEIDTRRDLVVGAHELAEVELLVPCAHRITLHEPIRVVTRQACLDEREQNALAEEEEVARFDVPSHPLLSHDKPVDEPGQA